MGLPGSDIAIDLGTATIQIYIKGKGIVLSEPTVVAYDRDTNKVIAIGTEAKKMLGRTPGNILAVRPLREGVISDYAVTEEMIHYFIHKIGYNPLIRPRIMVCVPSMITEVEERSVRDACKEAGARQVYLVEEPKAAAVGAGLDITSPCGRLIVDIGGGTTDIAVLSLNDAAVSSSIKIAGDRFNDVIVRYFRRRHSVLIGERMAEEVKIQVGCAVPRKPAVSMKVRGRCLLTGLPKSIEVTSDEICGPLQEPAQEIYSEVHRVIESTPPELAADILSYGITMTGGGSLLYGLDQYIAERTGTRVTVAENPVFCVATGTGKILDNLGDAPDGLLYISRNKNIVHNGD